MGHMHVKIYFFYRIWNYLIDLSTQENTTIILTTHYIEEARNASCLGFMRRGKIIEENTPEFLMKKYKHNILEEVFLSICTNISRQNNNESMETGEKSQNENHNKNSDQKLHRINSNADSLESLNLISAVINKLPEERLPVKSTKSYLKPIRKEFSISFSRLIANMYKDGLKAIRNKK